LPMPIPIRETIIKELRSLRMRRRKDHRKAVSGCLLCFQDQVDQGRCSRMGERSVLSITREERQGIAAIHKPKRHNARRKEVWHFLNGCTEGCSNRHKVRKRIDTREISNTFVTESFIRLPNTNLLTYYGRAAHKRHEPGKHLARDNKLTANNLPLQGFTLTFKKEDC